MKREFSLMDDLKQNLLSRVVTTRVTLALLILTSAYKTFV